MDGPGKKRTVNPIVKLLVIAHMVVIMSWSLPNPAPAIANGNIPATPSNIAYHFSDFFLAANSKFRESPPVVHTVYATGIWQYWDMFAPNPANTDYWYDSVVFFKSGRQETVPYPRMKDMPIWLKYFKERYRKYTERVDGVSDIWKRPAFAQRMALIAFKDPSDPPIRVILYKHWKQMPSMYEPVPNDYTVTEFFDYVVDQDKLRRDSGR